MTKSICRRFPLLALIVFTAHPAVATGTGFQAVVGNVFAANLNGGQVTQHSVRSGEFVGNLVERGTGGLAAGTGIAFGPDGDLFVASSSTNAILRFDGNTGTLRGPFIEDPNLERPFSIVFGPDGDLYVSSGQGHKVMQYSGDSGAFVRIVAEGLRVPIGLRFGPDGALYVANAGANEIVRIDPTTGTSSVFIPGEGGFPSDLVFSNDGSVLYVTRAVSREVLEYDAASGAQLRLITLLPEGSAPVGIDLSLDGKLLVADFGADQILEIDPSNGDTRVFSGGLSGPENLVVKRK